jgi:hypothetical protein
MTQEQQIKRLALLMDCVESGYAVSFGDSFYWDGQKAFEKNPVTVHVSISHWGMFEL